VAHGPGAPAHAAVKLGDATVVAAVGHQAKVVTKVKVLREHADASVPSPNPVHFDRLLGTEQLSVTAGTLGAGECTRCHY